MAKRSFFIDSDFGDYDYEIFSKDQIRDAFISALRSMSYDDDGVTLCMGASEPIDGILVISATFYSEYCTVELFKDSDSKDPVSSKDVPLEDALKAFFKFYKGEIPDLGKLSKMKRAFMIETSFTEFPIPVRSKDQIEELVSMLPDVDTCCCCDDDCCEDGCCDCCEDDAPYIVLIAPDDVKGAEYMQATYDCNDGWYVEISFTDKRKRMNLAELFSDDSEVIRLFNEFIDGNIPDVKDWTRVKI